MFQQTSLYVLCVLRGYITLKKGASPNAGYPNAGYLKNTYQIVKVMIARLNISDNISIRQNFIFFVLW